MNDYQKKAHATAIYPAIGHTVVYPALGLTNEAGEFAGKVKKVFRDHNGIFDTETREQLAHELGDVLWYLAECATAIGYDLQVIADMNALKLDDRKRRNVLQGSGDNR